MSDVQAVDYANKQVRVIQGKHMEAVGQVVMLYYDWGRDQDDNPLDILYLRLASGDTLCVFSSQVELAEVPA